jgi:DNA-binding response OmpR family regulator
MRDTLRTALTDQGWAVTTAPDSASALAVARDRLPDVVIARADPTEPSRLVEALRRDPATQSVVVVLFE